jgi:molybdopterin-biosynthesis enzyme MoeA-like protein
MAVTMLHTPFGEIPGVVVRNQDRERELRHFFLAGPPDEIADYE